jgi:hypothetical protein
LALHQGLLDFSPVGLSEREQSEHVAMLE